MYLHSGTLLLQLPPTFHQTNRCGFSPLLYFGHKLREHIPEKRSDRDLDPIIEAGNAHWARSKYIFTKI